MADVLQQLISVYPGARASGRPEWGAQNPDARLSIRRSLMTELHAPTSLEDLRVRPELPEWSISISHTEDFGGWVAIPSLYHVGFDVERRARLKREVIARVSTPAEVAAAPDPAFLWSAKEAAFKAAVGPEQPPTLSQIRIENWRAQFALWSFSSQQGNGWIATDVARIYAFFVL